MEITTLPPYFTTPAYENDNVDTLWSLRLNISIVAFSLVFVLGVIGNGLVIFITGFQMTKTVNTVWILNLAIADFTVTLFLPMKIVYLSLQFHWPFGHVPCLLENTLGFLNLYASVYFLVVISMDRCMSVWWPVEARNYRTIPRASFVALGVWILALVLSSPNLYFRNTYHNDIKNVTYCYSDYGLNEDEKSIRTFYTVVISRFILAFVIPFSVIAFCYGAMLWKLKRDRLSQSNKPFKVITAVIVAFFVCWLPYHIFAFLEVEIQGEKDNTLIVVGLPLTFCLAYFNSCLNPILYVFMGRSFKDRLRRSFLSIFENAFAEESFHATRSSTARSTSEVEFNNMSREVNP